MVKYNHVIFFYESQVKYLRKAIIKERKKANEENNFPMKKK